MSDRPETVPMRVILGDRYDDVMFRAMSAVASQPHGKPYTMRERVADTLAAVLPDLLAAAWEEGHRLGRSDAALNAVRVDGQYVQSINPYRQNSERAEAGA